MRQKEYVPTSRRPEKQRSAMITLHAANFTAIEGPPRGLDSRMTQTIEEG
jgi:hypothetical protein